MSEQFCLKWNNHQTTLVSVFDKLLECESLVDCSLAAEGKTLKAHKVVLSACSSYLEDILRNHEGKHPIIIFNDISFNELKAMLEYMYRGEVNVSQEQLNTFLKAAEALKIKGLTDQGGGGGNDGGGQENLKRKMGAARKTHSPVMGMTPVERPSSPKRRKPVRRQSRDENFPGDSNSCDTAPTPPPSQPQQINSIAARIEEKVAKIKKEKDSSGGTPAGGADPPGGAAALSALGMLQPKTEFLEESGNVEDLTLEEEEEYGPNPGTSQGSFSSQDFNNWQLGDPTNDEVFMASQHDLNNSAGNSQVDSRDLVDDHKVKFETLRALDHSEQMKMESQITDRTVQTVDEEEDPAMHTMMITPELLGLIPSSQSDCSDVCSTSTVKSNYSTVCTGMNGTNKSWNQEDMDQALQALRLQTMSLSKASATFGIPSTTLWQRAHRLGIDTPKKEGQTKSWTEHSLNTALEALRTGQISANKASKAYGIPSSTLYKIARREGIRLAAPFNAAPTAWVPEDLERALDAIRSGQCTVQRAAAEYGIPSGTLYGRCKREGIELSRNNPTPWSEEAMMDALEAVRIGQMSINQAAIHFNLPYSSLYGRFKRVKYESIGGNTETTQTSQQQQQVGSQPQSTPVVQQSSPPPTSTQEISEMEQSDIVNQQPQPQQPPTPQHSPTAPPPPPPQQQPPQIMLVQYQQPLHVYQPATAT